MFSTSNPLSSTPSILFKPEHLEWLISLAILPILIALLGQQQLFKGLFTLGAWSESLLQGISLPFLDDSE